MSQWILQTNNFKTTPIQGDVVHCQKNSIAWMSLKKLSLYWGLAIFSIFIPVLHFILVPLFLLIGAMAFFSQYKNTHFIQQGQYICPHCSNQVEIQSMYLFEGKKWNCLVCMEQMKLGKS